jgi:hypothetical protein
MATLYPWLTQIPEQVIDDASACRASGPAPQTRFQPDLARHKEREPSGARAHPGFEVDMALLRLAHGYQKTPIPAWFSLGRGSLAAASRPICEEEVFSRATRRNSHETVARCPGVCDRGYVEIAVEITNRSRGHVDVPLLSGASQMGC